MSAAHHHSRHAPRAKGFTLLELLAALALLALLMAGVWSGIRTATHTVRAGEAVVERIDAMRGAQQFLRREFAQVMAIPWALDDDGNGVVFSGNATGMRYVAPLPGYLGRLGPQLQTLRLLPDGDGRQRLEIAFALLPPDGSAPQPFGQPQVLLRGIREGEFAYRGFDAQERPVDWQSDWSDDSRTPALVQVKLQLADGSWPLLQAPLRVDASAITGPAALMPRMRMRPTR
jgi:general secretion pathway protein J